MRLLLLKICVGAMYFIIGCSQIQVSGEIVQPKQLIQVKQENLIRPGYYSYEILKSAENNTPHELVSKSAKQGANLSRENRKMIDKENRENKEVIKGNYKRFPLNMITFSANLNKQEINKKINNGKIIGFGNYLVSKEQIYFIQIFCYFNYLMFFFQKKTSTSSKEIPNIRRVRDIFPPLVDFKGLQDAIKASTYFSFYKDGNLSSFEHFDFHTNTHNFSTANNASQEAPRLTRSVSENENLIKKKSAISKFLLQFQDALEAVKDLTNGMFYPRVKDSNETYFSNAISANDTLGDEKLTRKIRQLSNEIDSSFKKKLIEMNQLTESIATRCNCLANKSCDKQKETEHKNCKNYEEVSKIVKTLNSLLGDFVDISVGELRKTKNFSDALMKLSNIKLKNFRSKLQKLKKHLSSNTA